MNEDTGNKNKCLCGSKAVRLYDDGGSKQCEKGHVYHICGLDSIKKYGWWCGYFDSDDSDDSDEQYKCCEILPKSLEK